MRIFVSIVAVALATAATGCISRSEGQLGHASFSYQECPFGCTITDHAMAAGDASAVIEVQLQSGYSFAAVRSTHPEIAGFAINPSGFGGGIDVGVTSGNPGTTQLQLLDAGGTLVDQIPVTVAAVARLAVKQGWSGSAPDVLAGSSQTFHVTTEDTGSHTLIGSGAVKFELAGSVAPAPALGGDLQGFIGTAGNGQYAQGSVTARAGSATAALSVGIVPLEAISLQSSVQANSVEGPNTYGNVTVVARAMRGPVYGANCVWTLSDPSVTLESQSVASLESAPQTTAKFLLAASGSFTATCTIDTASTVVQLHR